jgi:hypothetical protein
MDRGRRYVLGGTHIDDLYPCNRTRLRVRYMLLGRIFRSSAWIRPEIVPAAADGRPAWFAAARLRS